MADISQRTVSIVLDVSRVPQQTDVWIHKGDNVKFVFTLKNAENISIPASGKLRVQARDLSPTKRSLAFAGEFDYAGGEYVATFSSGQTNTFSGFFTLAVVFLDDAGNVLIATARPIEIRDAGYEGITEISEDFRDTILDDIATATEDGTANIQNAVEDGIVAVTAAAGEFGEAATRADANAKFALLTKEDRDGFQLNGGQLIVPTSINNTGMTMHAPLTIALTISEFKGWGEAAPTRTHRTFIGNYSYGTYGLGLAYVVASRGLEFRYGIGNGGNMGYTAPNFTLADGVNTVILSVSDELESGRLPVVMRQNGKALTGSYYGNLTTATFSTNAELRIGGATTYYTSSAEVGGMIAKISRVAFFNRVLTDAEMSAYERGEMPDNPAMFLGDGAGKQWRDASGNGNHANPLLGESQASKHRDVFINSERPAWTASGTKYLLHATEKILPDNCQFSPILLADKNCTMAIKDSTGAVYASVPLTAGVPVNAGTFFNLTDGRIALTPSALVGGYPLTVSVNLEVRKF